jgi:hypothetical protein
MSAKSTMMMPHGFQNRTNPEIAVSPVASVYRSISMLRKYCSVTPMKTAHMNVSPTCVVM